MKKLLALLLSLCLVAALCAGCGSTPTPADDDSTTTTPEEPVTVRLGGLKGPTSMGMVKLLSDNDAGKTTNHYEFSMAGSADELTPKMLQGELDILAVPVNLGSVLYNNSDGAVQLLAVNTLGVIYLVEKGGQTVTDWNSLKGQTIYATGKGSTPEYALNYLLEENGLDPAADVTIQWLTAQEVTANMLSAEDGVCMLPVPAATALLMKDPGVRQALDLSAEWDAVSSTPLPMGCIVARREFVEEHPEAVDAFLDLYGDSISFMSDEGNRSEAAELVAKYGITANAQIAEAAIPQCNLTLLTGEEMQDTVQAYYEVLYRADPAAIGGSIPYDSLYYLP